MSTRFMRLWFRFCHAVQRQFALSHAEVHGFMGFIALLALGWGGLWGYRWYEARIPLVSIPEDAAQLEMIFQQLTQSTTINLPLPNTQVAGTTYLNASPSHPSVPSPLVASSTQTAPSTTPIMPPPSSTHTQATPGTKYVKKKKPTYFDINQADVHVLQQLPGIGPTLAQRIIKYRNALGGMVGTHQYAEVYGITPLAKQQLQCYAFIAPSYQPRRIDLNHGSPQTLQRHPYCTYAMAQAILQMRLQYKGRLSLEILRTQGHLSLEAFQQLAPYLTAK